MMIPYGPPVGHKYGFVGTGGPFLVTLPCWAGVCLSSASVSFMAQDVLVPGDGPWPSVSRHTRRVVGPVTLTADGTTATLTFPPGKTFVPEVAAALAGGLGGAGSASVTDFGCDDGEFGMASPLPSAITVQTPDGTTHYANGGGSADWSGVSYPHTAYVEGGPAPSPFFPNPNFSPPGSVAWFSEPTPGGPTYPVSGPGPSTTPTWEYPAGFGGGGWEALPDGGFQFAARTPSYPGGDGSLPGFIVPSGITSSPGHYYPGTPYTYVLDCVATAAVTFDVAAASWPDGAPVAGLPFTPTMQPTLCTHQVQARTARPRCRTSPDGPGGDGLGGDD